MSSILVVEQELRYIERITAALSGEGWRVRVVQGHDQALQAASAERPDLFVVSTEVPGVEALASSFSRSAGGPGVVALLPESAEQDGTGAVEADDLLPKPFSDQDLRSVVRRALAERRSAPQPFAPFGEIESDHKLTSLDIFGDVLAEVEGDGIAVPAPARPAAPPPPRPAPHGDDDVERRLERTLSGVFTPEAPKPRPAAPTPPAAGPPAPPARKPAATSDIDALLNKTLGNLDMGKPRPAAPPKPAAPAPAPAAPRPAAAAPVKPVPAPPPMAPPPPAVLAPPPVAAPPQESTAVRKMPRPVGDFDLAELEELARGTRRPEPARAPAPAAPPRPPAAAPAPPVQAVPAAAPVRPVTPPPAPPAPERTATPMPMRPQPVPAAPVASVAPVPSVVAPVLDPAATQRIPVVPREEAAQDASGRFGQYEMLERIAIGGMAEVWKARMRGVEGFQKTVAIKKILPHMTDNSEFIGMFIDEAKLAAQLNHPNIVHIYDLGKIGRDYYIAMEYVDGKDLRSLLNAARRKGMPLPMGLALLVGSRLASALDYAHRKRDFEGQELGLVHRDVSPQNVLLTAEGDVKLCDFGIAKAVSKVGQTQMGALKGKLQYMSPEQAWGRAIDARSDIFSLGAVLFEMLTGERLFPGDTEMSVLEAVRQVRIRSPRQVVPTIPKEVDDVVLKALAKEPEDRFPTAGEMAQRLESALAALTPFTPNPSDLAAYVQRVLEVVPETASPAPVPPLPVLEPLPAPAPEPVPLPEPVAVAATREPEPEPLPPPAMPVAPPDEVYVPAVAPLGDARVEEEAPRKSRTLLYAAIAALLVLVILSFFFLNRRAPETETPAVSPAETPAAGNASGAVLPGAPSPTAAPAGTPAPAPGVDVSALVNQKVAEQETAMRRKMEEEAKRLQKEIDAAKAAGRPVPQATPTPAPAKVEVPAPAPAETPRQEPPAAVAAVPEPTPEPPAPEPVRQPEPEPSPATSTTPTEVVGEVVPPQLVSFPKPQYPPVARRMGVEGTVIVSAFVDEEGRVQEVKLVSGVQQKVGLNEAALDVARKARFKPATKNGVRVKMWTRLKIPFKL
ncbi:MAG TPA: TonB family protein [Thermoanaerobaculia bacterium]|nr:TonB family protein [Thermoanaerobaculia bacterium]